MLMIEFDLAGAEWVVVAYLSGDKNMIGVVESGKSPHIVTGALISGAPEDFVLEEHKLVGSHTDQDVIAKLRMPLAIPEGIRFLPRSMSIRQAGKKSNHGLNYGMRHRRAALEWEIAEKEAEPIVEAYSSVAYPGLKDYWEGIRQELKDNNRTMENCFGRKVRLLGEWGQELFNEAYSFKPQSTVVDIVLQAMCDVFEDRDLCMMQLRLGAQVHDSLMVQAEIPTDAVGWDDLAIACMKTVRYLRPDIHYGEHTFKLDVDAKIGLSWGGMHKLPITDSPVHTAEALRRAVAVLQEQAVGEVVADAAE